MEIDDQIIEDNLIETISIFRFIQNLFMIIIFSLVGLISLIFKEKWLLLG